MKTPEQANEAECGLGAEAEGVGDPHDDRIGDVRNRPHLRLVAHPLSPSTGMRPWSA